MRRLLSLLSIRTRVLGLVFGTALPLLALLVIDAEGDRRAAIERAMIEVDAAAHLAAERHSKVFDEAKVLLSMLSLLPDMSADGSPACSAAVRRAVARTPQFMTIGVVDAEGTIVCHSKINRRQAFTDQELVKRAIAAPAGTLVTGNVITGRVTGKPTVVLGFPLERADGNAAGMLFASLDLSEFSAVADLAELPFKRTVTVVDAVGGKVIAGSGDQRGLIGRSFAGHALVDLMAKTPQGGALVISGLKGEEEIIGFAAMRTEGLSRPMIAVAVPREVALVEANALAINRLSLALLVTGLACAAAWAFGYWTLDLPMRELTSVAARIGGGDLSSRAEPQPWQSREILSLGATLNTMAARLDSATRSLHLLANEDALTGLANRRRFDAALQAECARHERSRQPLSLLIVDVDHFKVYNDTHGHVAGDECLRRIGRVIASFAARPGDVAARYGGEEFALILPSTDRSGAAQVAAGILRVVRGLGIANAGAGDGIMAVSVGSTTVIDHDGPLLAEHVIRKADDALYLAKKNGRNRHVAAETGADAALYTG